MFGFSRKPKQIPTPSVQNFDKFNERVEFTPDSLILERRYSWNVFVYDDLMKGRVRHDLLGEDAVRHCTAFTKDHFTLWHKDLGKLSTVIPLEEHHQYAPHALVKGELFAVRSQQIINALDKEYENGVRYLRKRVKVSIPFSADSRIDDKRRALGPFLAETDAWMYVGIPNYWGPMVRKRGSTIRTRQVDGSVVISKTYYDRHANILLSPSRTYIPNNPLLERYYYFSGDNDRDTSNHS